MSTTNINFPARFLTYLEVEKNCSWHTIESYQKDLTAFEDFMLHRRGNQKFFWQEVSPLDVRAYLAELNEKQYARRTIARRISALRSFFKYLVREAVIEYSPLTKVRTPKLEKKLPVFLDEIEVNELLIMPDKSKLLGVRDQAVLEMLYATGCRVSELVGLTLERVDLSNRFVLLLGKGNKERVVPVGHTCCAALSSYYPVRQQLMLKYHEEHEFIFVNNRGGRLTDVNISHMFI